MIGKAIVGVIVLLLLPTAILRGQSPVTHQNDPPCNEQGCHHLDDSVSVEPAHVASLVALLRQHDSDLASQVQLLLDCDHCRPRDILDRYGLITVSINAESRVKVDPGSREPKLTTGRWNYFLIKVQNLAGITAPLRLHCDQAISSLASEAKGRWVEIEFVYGDGVEETLSGELLEYRLIRLRSNRVGYRAAVVALDVGQGTADIGFRNDVMLTFRCDVESSPRLISSTDRSNQND
jgi:hypothetical protein